MENALTAALGNMSIDVQVYLPLSSMNGTQASQCFVCNASQVHRSTHAMMGWIQFTCTPHQISGKTNTAQHFSSFPLYSLCSLTPRTTFPRISKAWKHLAPVSPFAILSACHATWSKISGVSL